MVYLTALLECIPDFSSFEEGFMLPLDAMQALSAVMLCHTLLFCTVTLNGFISGHNEGVPRGSGTSLPSTSEIGFTVHTHTK